MTLNKLVLDDLVQGHDSNSETWKLLIQDRDREEKWEQAVKRREQINQFCRFVVEWPTLAKRYMQICSLKKKNILSPELNLLEVMSRDEPLRALLRNEIERAPCLKIDVEWGTQKIIELEYRMQLRFIIERHIPVHYSYGEEQGWICTQDSWDYVPTEGAVILTFVDTKEFPHMEDELKEISEEAESISTIVLLPT